MFGQQGQLVEKCNFIMGLFKTENYLASANFWKFLIRLMPKTVSFNFGQ